MSNDPYSPAYIATLAWWWEEAEQGPVHKGDIVIKRHPDGRYTIREAEKGWENTNYRILSRATPPKPAWHDAVAVMAHTEDDDTRRAFIPRYFSTGERSGAWDDRDGGWEASLLIDPVPLIEARVDDEMVQRARSESNLWEPGGFPDNILRAILTAALGIGDDK